MGFGCYFNGADGGNQDDDNGDSEDSGKAHFLLVSDLDLVKQAEGHGHY